MGFHYRRAAVAVASLLLSSAIAPDSLPAQAIIRGVLYDDATGAVVRGTVMLVDPATDGAAVHAVTDSLGQFVLQTPAGGGVYQVAAVRAGYTSVLSARIQLVDGERMTLRVPIAPTGDPVHSIGVLEHVKPDAPARPVVMDAFDRRRASGVGVHYDREQLARSNVSTLGEFLRGVPGFHVVDPSSASTMSMSRSASPSGLGSRTSSGAACHVGWFMDGHRMDLPGLSDPMTDGFASVPLETLDGIEVFRGVAETPPEFSAPDLRCGVVALWTRRR